MYKILFILIFLNLFLPVSYAEQAQIGRESNTLSVQEGGLISQKQASIMPIGQILTIQKEEQAMLRQNPANQDAIYLTLEEATEFALVNNFDIQLAQFDAQFKQTDLDKVRSIYDAIIEAEIKLKNDRKKRASNLIGTKTETRDYNLGVSRKLPTGTTLGLDFSNQRSWTNASAYTTVNPAHESSLQLTLEQELGKNLFGLIDRSNIKITKIDIENAQYTSLDKIEQVLAQVQEAYWRVVQYLNIVSIRKDMVLKAGELFRINKQKFARGIIEEPQLVASQANLEQREIDLILAQNDLQSQVNELRLLLNLEDKDKVILPRDDFILFAPPAELKQALKQAFTHRRDYHRADNQIKAEQIKLVMQENNLWPEINLEASIARNGLTDRFSSAINDISTEDNPEYSIGLSVSFPLENREAKSELNKARIEKAKALINLKKIERQIFVQIQDSVRNCNILFQRLNKQENVVKLQEEKFAAELKTYQYGRSDTDTIINYQDDLLLSQIAYMQAFLDYKDALIDLSLKENVLLDRFWEDTL